MYDKQEEKKEAIAPKGINKTKTACREAAHWSGAGFNGCCSSQAMAAPPHSCQPLDCTETDDEGESELLRRAQQVAAAVLDIWKERLAPSYFNLFGIFLNQRKL
jgi:hypothetical protein